MEKKVALIIAQNGYQHIEYGIPKRMLDEVGIAVVTVSTERGTATGNDGSTTTVDETLATLTVSDYDGVFFVGGPGALEHLENQTCYTIAQKAVQADIPLGAICISTRILAQAGVLTNKQATGWNGDNELGDIYRKYKVDYINQDVVVDGNIITAVGPHAAQLFGKTIIKLVQK